MTSVSFCYWLQGYFEINGVDSITKEQAKVISDHLNLVFHHEIDKIIDEGKTEKEKLEYDTLHGLSDSGVRLNC